MILLIESLSFNFMESSNVIFNRLIYWNIFYIAKNILLFIFTFQHTFTLFCLSHHKFHTSFV